MYVLYFILQYYHPLFFMAILFYFYRERGLRRLREELRAEEMKLVLLKKLKQSQQLKENVAVLPPSIPPSAIPPTGLPSGLSITPTTVKVPNNKVQQPPTAHLRHPTFHKAGVQGNSSSILRGVSLTLKYLCYIDKTSKFT